MLTGSTVEQWDTMVYLKDKSSPQEYDQAIFRLQNQYVRTLYPGTAQGQATPIRENLKPQTLLVDFDPDRLFRMSPIVAMNLGKLVRVQAADVLAAVSEYSSRRSVADEARDIPVDLGLLEDPDIRRAVEAQSEIGSRSGLTLDPHVGDDTDIDTLLPEGAADTGDRMPSTPDSQHVPRQDSDAAAKSLTKKL